MVRAKQRPELATPPLTAKLKEAVAKPAGKVLKWGMRTLGVAPASPLLPPPVSPFEQEGLELKASIFLYSLIALAGKVARADGELNVKEITEFSNIFPIPEAIVTRLPKLLTATKDDPADCKHYALKIMMLYPEHIRLREEIINNLLCYAECDGAVGNAELNVIRTIAMVFGYAPNDFKLILRQHIMPDFTANPYQLLDLPKQITVDELRKRYHRMVRDCHPDNYGSKDVADDIAALLQEKFVIYTNAYDAIIKQRNW